MENNNSRRISLEKDFMDYKSGNDLLYGFMLNLATYDPEKERLYLTVNQFNKHRKIIKTILNVTQTRSVNSILDKLRDSGLIDMSSINIGSFKNVPCFIFPFEPEGRYKIVKCDMIQRIIYCCNHDALRVYMYLLNKYQWKRDYEFTITEIRKELGYSEKTCRCDERIIAILDFFRAAGIIQYEERYIQNIYNVTIPVKILKFVALDSSEINDRIYTPLK